MRKPALLLLASIGLYAIGDATLAPAPSDEHPGFIDAVLASRAVVAAVRIAVIFAAGFVVLSVIALGRQGRWLIRVGPVEVSEIAADGRQLAASVEKRQEEAASLRQQLSRSEHLLEQVMRAKETR